MSKKQANITATILEKVARNSDENGGRQQM